MTDIAPATDERIARLEWWLSRAVQFLDGPGEQKWFTLPDISADELSTLRGLTARIRAADDKIAELQAALARSADVLLRAMEKERRFSAELAKRDDALRSLVEAKALAGIRALVAGWNGEGRPDGPYERHPAKLGAQLKTNCGAVYVLDEAMQVARSIIEGDDCENAAK